jgi:hypothetical protein
LGWGLTALAQRVRWAAAVGGALAVTVALSGLASFYPGRARRDDYTSLAATLRAYVRSGDRVVLHNDKDWPIFAAHYAGGWRGVPNGAPVDGGAADSILAPLWEQADGIWLAVTPDAQRNDPRGEVIAWLEARAIAVKTWHFGENDLYFYARTPGRAAERHDLAPDFAPPVAAAVEVAPDVMLLAAEVPLSRYRTGDTLHLFLYWDPPPEEAVVAWLWDTDGLIHREVIVPVPVPARIGPTRQQLDLPLTPDLRGGRYRIVLQAAPFHLQKGSAIEVGRFTLVFHRMPFTRDLAANVPPADIPYRLDVCLGEGICLLGYDLPQSVVEPGGVVELTLYWQAAAPVQTRYKIFTHLLGEAYNAATGNFLWGQQDNEPVNGHVPTTMWTPGVIIADPYRIPVAADVPPGRYLIEVGMYGLVDGVRLPVLVNGVAADDRVLLQPVEVMRK